jgi:hypothetical protein
MVSEAVRTQARLDYVINAMVYVIEGGEERLPAVVAAFPDLVDRLTLVQTWLKDQERRVLKAAMDQAFGPDGDDSNHPHEAPPNPPEGWEFVPFPKPDAPRYTMVGMSLPSCSICGGTVDPLLQQAHTAWHARIDREDWRA